MEIPFSDPERINRPLVAAFEAALRRVVSSRRYLAGDEVSGFERELAALLGASFVVATASGPDGLLVALKALGAGAGDGVVVPALASVSAPHAVVLAGARPVFVDVEAETLTLDPARLAKVSAWTDRIKAVIVEHLFGEPAQMREIRKITEKRGLPLIEVAFHALGTMLDNRPAGTLGDIGCFSFHAAGNLGALGDAGALVASDDTLAARLRMLATSGRTGRYQYAEAGLRARMHDLQAAILREKLKYLPEWSEARIAAAQYYRDLIIERGLTAVLRPPRMARGRPVLGHYVCRAARRDEMGEFLAGRGITADALLPTPLHLMESSRRFGYREGDFPVAEAAARSLLALPFHQAISRTEQANVIEAAAIFFARRKV